MKKFMYCLLAALLIQIILTVLAFQHLEWWQAILASFLLFMVMVRLLVWVAKLLFVRFLRRTQEDTLRAANPHLLENAQFILHSISPSALPRHLAYALDNPDLTDAQRSEQYAEYNQLGWHEIEVTIIPNTPTDPKLGRAWRPYYLSLLPYDATPPSSSLIQLVKGGSVPTNEGDCPQTFELHDLSILRDKGFRLLQDDADIRPIEGPQRLRFIVGIPREQSLLKFLYQNVTFGRLELHVPANRPLLDG